MKPAFALVLFYLLIAMAILVLRGDLMDWPRIIDRVLAFTICLGAVALLLRSWRSRHPGGGPAEDGSSRPQPVWIWWAGIAGLAAFVFLAALPPLSVVMARPQLAERLAKGEDSPGPTPAPPSPDGTLPKIDPSASGAVEGAAEGVGNQPAAELGNLERLLERLREFGRERPPWLVALLLLALLALAACLAWWVRRLFGANAVAPPNAPPTPWHDDPAAPAYIREFRRLCEQLGHAPRPGDTWRDLLRRLQAGTTPALPSAEPLEPVAIYHYRVRYEGATPDSGAERGFIRLIRETRKAATSARAKEKATAE
ncbi:MAG: hypothetical protein ACKV19_18420 [Verrucomicrobiales bacterium]